MVKSLMHRYRNISTFRNNFWHLFYQRPHNLVNINYSWHGWLSKQMSFLRPLTRNYSVHSPKFLLLRTDRSACCVSLYLSLWHLPWNISPQNKNRWSLYLKSPTRAEHEMSKIPINCVLFLKTRAPFMLNKQANISNNRAIAHNVKGERERDLQERCLWPSGFAKSIAAMSNRPATWSSLSLSAT